MSGERTILGGAARYPGGLHQLAPGAWAWLQPNGEWGEANAGLVAGDGAALVIDTLWDLRLAERMRAAMRAATDAPIRTVVNTHADGDHTWGNQLFAGEGAEIVASARTAAAMEEDPAGLQRFRALARHGRRVRVPGHTLARYVDRMLGGYDFSGVRVTPPTRTFDGELALDVGGREVRLMEVGPAHTAGDTVVLVPDARVAYAADVLFAGVVPVMWAGPVRNWVAALDLLLEADVERIVPGHGPLCGKGDVQVLRDYWTWLEAAARPLLVEGDPLEHVATELVRSDAYRAAPWAGWDGPERIVINLAALDHERRGVPFRVTPLGRVRLFAKVAAVARELRGGRSTS